MIIKALLIFGLLITAVVAFGGKASPARLAMTRLGGGLILTSGVLAIIFPDGVTAIANTTGVHRGTDLLLYVFVLAFLLVSVTLYRKVRDLEDLHVQLARSLAISEAQREGSQVHKDPPAQPFST